MLFCGAIYEARDGGSAAGGPHQAVSATVPYSERQPVAGQCPRPMAVAGSLCPRSRARFVRTGFQGPLSSSQGRCRADIAPARVTLLQVTRRDAPEPSQPPPVVNASGRSGGGFRTTPWGLVSATVDDEARAERRDSRPESRSGSRPIDRSPASGCRAARNASRSDRPRSWASLISVVAGPRNK
jgi:hypothetical protein